MKVSIVVFSPSGNTLRAASMLREKLRERSAEVQLLDLTRRADLFGVARPQALLEELLDEHKLLCIGGPVYAHHLHYNVLRLIDSLPRPGGKFGRLAVPFVTYGTISSGVSLREAAAALRRSGRITPFAMKVEAFHCMSRLLSLKVGEGLPDERSLPIIEDLANRIVTFRKETDLGCSPRSFDYQNRAAKIKARVLFRERLWQRRIYPALVLDGTKCRRCATCVGACPVQRLKLSDGTLDIAGEPGCIHCGQCIAACATGAISFRADLAKWDELFALAAAGKGLMSSHEAPRSAVYPLRASLEQQERGQARESLV